jgi:DNA primase catalytic core
MSLSPQFLDELRARTLLSTLVGRTVKLTKAGREYKGCCPFHNEKTPSFYVNDDKGFYHCFAGETEVITPDGRTAIRDLAGTKATILSRNGQWISAPVKSYGVQRLWRIELSRNRVRKEIYATSGHRWFVHDRISVFETSELKPGHALQSSFPERRTNWELDPEGVRHGIVYGDGSMYKQVYGTLNLHGDKDAELRHWFPAQDHHVHERSGGALYLRIYGGRAFESMKQMPAEQAQDSYLLGFLAGYLAADGHVAKDGTVMLNSADPKALETVRDIATRLGIATFGRTTLYRKGFGQQATALHRIHFVRSTLAEELFLLKKARKRFAAHTKKYERLRWVVRSVEPTDREEIVYCAEVPGEHAFTLNDNILTGNCFGCSAHGDAIRWMTDNQGLPFMDAVKELAQNAGIEVPAPDPRAAERAERGNALYDVMEAAQNWFVEQFSGIEGAEARAYCAARGLKPETLRDFGIGYAPDSRGKLKTALTRFGDAKLIEAGLLISVDDKQPYDRFRGRLMIPIRDPRGRVIAFGGRILGAGEPKYLNSPDTPLFDKGRTLYNLDKAGAESRKANRMIVVEGYMDVIALAQAGIGEVVAPLGTALTEHQLERLWRQVPAPILCFDGDAAGQRASVRALGRALPLLGSERTLGFVTLPQGQDPDDLVKSGGRNAAEALFASPEPLVERLWRHELNALPLATPEARAGLRQRVQAQAAAIADPDVREQYRLEFRMRLDALFAPPPRSDANRQTFSVRANQGGKGPNRWRQNYEAPPGHRAQAISGKGVEPVFARAILSGLVRHPAMIMACAEAISQLPFADPELSRLRDTLIDAGFDHPGLESDALVTICQHEGFASLIEALLSTVTLGFSFARDEADGEIARRDLAMAIEALAARPELDAALAAATVRLGAQWDDAGFAEQQRLRAARVEADQRLASLAAGDKDGD